MSKKSNIYTSTVRRWFLLVIFSSAMLVLIARAIDLQVLNNDFLQTHGDARSLRVMEIQANRGNIFDRNGEPLAISTPVNSIWATPRKVLNSNSNLLPLSKLLDMHHSQMLDNLQTRMGREFVYIKRQVAPDIADRIIALDIPGIYLQREFKRYYPAGEISSHVIGFTNVDDIGQEGIELAYNEWLQGTSGSKRVLVDRLGRVVEDVESIQAPKPGKALYLSIDQRIQYLAYRELKSAINRHHAKSGSLIMLDAKSGEILALVGQPSFNPNDRAQFKGENYRCRALTDTFEPGSTLKPFTIAAALESGDYTPATPIDTAPGYFSVGEHKIQDIKNYGLIDVATVIKKSSNVGASKIALSLEPSRLWEMFSQLGFGQPTGSAFPGEAAGQFTTYNNWSELELATISFGYGISVNALQLAQAYMVLASHGIKYPISFHKLEKPASGERILSETVSKQVNLMLESVVKQGGTGTKADVIGYRVAGKTGTVHKSEAGGYSENKYLSLFSGFAPVSDPRIVLVVIIDQPSGDQYYGGQVAAPLFSNVMTAALRMLNVAPDDWPENRQQIMAKNSGYRTSAQ